MGKKVSKRQHKGGKGAGRTQVGFEAFFSKSKSPDHTDSPSEIPRDTVRRKKSVSKDDTNSTRVNEEATFERCPECGSDFRVVYRYNEAGECISYEGECFECNHEEPIDEAGLAVEIIEPKTNRKTDGTTWYCRACEIYFHGPPRIVNLHPHRDPKYNQNRCIKCDKCECHTVWGSQLDPSIEVL